MKTFATLAGSDTPSAHHQPVFEHLVAIAVARGFVPPDASLPIVPDQVPLDGWSLELRGPSGGRAAFLLSVIAGLPGIAPIPVRQTIDAPLFAVVVMPTFLGVFAEGVDRDFREFTDVSAVVVRFNAFLDLLENASQIARPR